VNLGFVRRLRCIPGVEAEDLYRLQKLLVDGQPVDEWDLKNGDSPYGREVRLTAKVHIEADQVLLVEREETVMVPVDDAFNWFVAEGKSLRRLQVTCTFDRDVFPQITANGISENRDYPKMEKSRECSLDWRGWMLPRHGYVIWWSRPQ
jgi:hypothetical protein